MGGREFLVKQAQAAAALGHSLELEHRPPPPAHPAGNHKWWVRCSCGYASTAKATQAVALGSGFHHLGQVVAEVRRSGVSSPVSPPRARHSV